MMRPRSRTSKDNALETFRVESAYTEQTESMERLIADNMALTEANYLLHEALDERDATIERLKTQIGVLQERVHVLESHPARKRQVK